MINPFFNKGQGRPRAAWRIILFLAAIWLGSSALSFAASATGIAALKEFASPIMICLVLWLAGRSFDRRPFADYGFSLNGKWWLDLGAGFALGGILMAGIFGIQAASGLITIKGSMLHPSASSFWRGASSLFILFAGISLQEEILTRGFLLRNLAEGLNIRLKKERPDTNPEGMDKKSPSRRALFIAYALSSLIFGILHAANPNASLMSILIIIAAGLFLGLPFILSGELGFSLGLHLSWNFFQGVVFGFPVSGMRTAFSFIGIEQSGPAWLTGGSFGPEGGLLGLAAIIAGSALIILWHRISRGKPAPRESLAAYSPPEPLTGLII